jgi:hypothetical protein
VPNRRGIVLIAALALVPGCNSGESPSRFALPAAPTIVSTGQPAPAPPTRTALQVVDGWTGAAVAGVQVAVDGAPYATDVSGQAETPLPCQRATFTARGYLERSIVCRVDLLYQPQPVITLWPVADEAEREATRRAVFPDGRLSFGQPTDRGVDFDTALANIDVVRATWAHAGRRVSELTSGRVVPTFGPLRSDEGYIVAEAGDPPGCTHSWFAWSFAVSGFCWDRTPDYFIYRLMVASTLLERDDVALRALLYGWGLQPHSLPGLMNETRPSSALSDFELKTIHMASLRGNARVGWPDIEQ